MKRTLSQRRRSETSLSAEQRKPPYRMTSIRRQALFSEQVAVRPGAGQGQHQHFILDAVDQQLIREDMTFTVSDPISGQRVILVLFGERFTHCKGGDHFLQQFNFQATLHSQLEILFELRGGLDGVLCFSHAFRSAKSSSRSLYPFTDGSFAILSASNMAAIVSLLG